MTIKPEIPATEQGLLKIHNPNKERLQSFIDARKGGVFTLEDVVDFLEINHESGGIYYGVPTITDTLRNLGCGTIQITYFIPPRRVDKDQIVT